MCGGVGDTSVSDDDRNLSPATPELTRLAPVRSALSKQQFLEKLAQSIDDRGTLWRLNPETAGAVPLMGDANCARKYVGTIEKNEFFLRRPLLEGAERIGLTVRGKVLDTDHGCLITITCEPNPALSLFIGFCGLQFVLAFLFAFIYWLSVKLTVAQGLQVLLTCLTFSAPLFLGGLLLKLYIRLHLFPDRELFEHVLRIACQENSG